MNKVSIVTANYENIEKQLKQSLESINYQPKKKKFLIKPNIVGPKDPDSPVITNPKVVIALIKFLKPFAEEIVIGEGSVAGTPTTKAFKAAGYEEIAKKYGVKLLDFDNCKRIEKEWKY